MDFSKAQLLLYRANWLRSPKVARAGTWIARTAFGAVFFLIAAGNFQLFGMSSAELIRMEEAGQVFSVGSPGRTIVLGFIALIVLNVITTLRPLECWSGRLVRQAAMEGHPDAIMEIATEFARALRLHTEWAYPDARSMAPASPRIERAIAGVDSLLGISRRKQIRHEKEATWVEVRLSCISDADAAQWRDAQYLLGLLRIRGPLKPDEATAERHLSLSHAVGSSPAACELALLKLGRESGHDEARALLQSNVAYLPAGKLKEVAELQLARLEFMGTENSERDLQRSLALTDSLLGIHGSDVSAEQMKSIRPYSYTPELIRKEASDLRRLVDVEIKADFTREQRKRARDELYSFITHSIPNAMASVVGETEMSLEILRDTTSPLEDERSHLIRSLSGALGRAAFVDSLLATHRLLITGKDRLNEAWAIEQQEPPIPVLMLVIDAAKQAVSQALFTDLDYAQLGVPTSDDLAINLFRSRALANLIGRTESRKDCDEFLAYCSENIPVLRFDLDSSIEWPAARNGIRIGVVLSAASELIRNALRHRKQGTSVVVALKPCSAGFQILAANEVSSVTTSSSGGTRLGLAFVREFAAVIDALSYKQYETRDGYTAGLEVAGALAP